MRRRQCIEIAFESDRLWSTRLRRAYDLVVPVARREERAEAKKAVTDQQIQPRARPEGGTEEEAGDHDAATAQPLAEVSKERKVA